MKYNVATIDCTGLEEWQTDVLSQSLADMGFDSFEQDGEILRAYVPADFGLADEGISGLVDIVAENGARLVSFEMCPDENWNAAWEAEHEVEELPMGVRIVPHCAFGAGHHETTAMMVDALVERSRLVVSTVLDMGTGTGVLGIMAAKLGAKKVIAVDIDDNSVTNARENAAANDVTLDVRLGSNVPEGKYDLILANIHRNILLAQMGDYARTLNDGGELWLSGFYEQDIPALVEAAAAHNLHHIANHANGDWRMLMFGK